MNKTYKLLHALGLSLLLLSTSALALTLDEARQQGRVGETLSGFLAPRASDAQTQALVKQINDQRARNYQQLGTSNNISADDVARLAGQKLVERAKSGEYVRGINGMWMLKP
ncbi:YdbL family protein [Shimwellia pseudoproteus]|uniref:YdbL family protein n=1 Tax=Shimwellia pseudoproteus TaxID=570012 RepID=UPI0018ECBAE4|nr:YdbL family protein [Shimwellia pseudoproteus]MBJ3816536.1 YdbL family protein [Shimwellia pseudoproteus]